MSIIQVMGYDSYAMTLMYSLQLMNDIIALLKLNMDL